MLIEIVVQIAREIASNGPRQIRRVRGPTEKSCLRLDNVVSKGAHVSRDTTESFGTLPLPCLQVKMPTSKRGTLCTRRRPLRLRRPSLPHYNATNVLRYSLDLELR